MTTTYTVNGGAINAHSCIGCTLAETGSTYHITGSVISAYGCMGCAYAGAGNTHHVTGYAINAYNLVGCPFILGLTPNVEISERAYIDLVYTVWTANGPLALDNATVEWVAGGQITKSTEDYSIITFGNTLVVHLTPDDIIGSEALSYLATITTADAVYTMTGLFTTFESAIDVCFMAQVLLPERQIATLSAVQRMGAAVIKSYEHTPSVLRGERRMPLTIAFVRAVVEQEIPEREPSSIICSRAPQNIPVVERTQPSRINVAPCGKRRL